MSITAEQLQAFVKAAETGSFSATARALQKSQPSVSAAIANLEVDLGVELFDRSGHKPVLTDLGRSLLSNAYSVIAQTLEMQSKANSIGSGVEHKLTVVIEELAPHEPLFNVLQEFEALFPHT